MDHHGWPGLRDFHPVRWVWAEHAQWLQLQLYPSTILPLQSCNSNSCFQLFDGETDIEGQIITFCGSIAESRQTDTNVLYVRWVHPSQKPMQYLSNTFAPRYFAEAKGIGSEFAAWYSVLTPQVISSMLTKKVWKYENQPTSQEYPTQSGQPFLIFVCSGGGKGWKGPGVWGRLLWLWWYILYR